MSDFFTTKELDQILFELNRRAYFHENKVIKEHAVDKQMSMDQVLELLAAEAVRIGSVDLIRSVEGFILATMYGYSVADADNGDLLVLREEHIDKGLELVQSNPRLWGERVFPLLLYATEYMIGFHERVPRDKVNLGELGFANTDEGYLLLGDTLLRAAIQTRYAHFIKCDVEDAFGNPDYRHEDHSHETINDARVINVE